MASARPDWEGTGQRHSTDAIMPDARENGEALKADRRLWRVSKGANDMSASNADFKRTAAVPVRARPQGRVETSQQGGAAALPPGRHRPREHLQAFVDEIFKDAELMAQLRDATGSGEKMRDAICRITTRVHSLDASAGLWEGAQVTAILSESLSSGTKAADHRWRVGEI